MAAIWDSPAFRLIGMGSSLALSIVLPTLFGRWLDGRFDTAPTWTLVFLVLGLVIGLVGAYQQLHTVLAQIEARRRRDRAE